MREMMKTMGLSTSLHWLGWFIKCLAMLEASILGMILFMCVPTTMPPLFAYSNPLVIWLFLNVYAISIITFCFLASVIFKKSSLATSIGSLAFFSTALPFLILSEKFRLFSYGLKILCCLPLNSGMGAGLNLILLRESDEVGVNFSNLFSYGPSIELSLGEVLIVMIATAIAQMILTVYIEKVFPGDIGVPEPWHFPLTRVIELITANMGSNQSPAREGMMIERILLGNDFEEEPTNLRPGIRVVNLSKSFGTKFAVKKLNLNIYEGQITVLLGHNGAGKTTTMSMLVT
jgi:ATP-binding cassette, subfamily A (ABC1), member 3